MASTAAVVLPSLASCLTSNACHRPLSPSSPFHAASAAAMVSFHRPAAFLTFCTLGFLTFSSSLVFPDASPAPLRQAQFERLGGEPRLQLCDVAHYSKKVINMAFIEVIVAHSFSCGRTKFGVRFILLATLVRSHPLAVAIRCCVHPSSFHSR